MTTTGLIKGFLFVLFIGTNIFLAVQVWNLNFVVNALIDDYNQLQIDVDDVTKNRLIK